MTLEQGTFENGQLTHGSMYVWFYNALDLIDASEARADPEQWKRYIDRITSCEDQRQRREYVLARIQPFVDGSCQSIEFFHVPRGLTLGFVPDQSPFYVQRKK